MHSLNKDDILLIKDIFKYDKSNVVNDIHP